MNTKFKSHIKNNVSGKITKGIILEIEKTGRIQEKNQTNLKVRIQLYKAMKIEIFFIS